MIKKILFFTLIIFCIAIFLGIILGIFRGCKKNKNNFYIDNKMDNVNFKKDNNKISSDEKNLMDDLKSLENLEKIINENIENSNDFIAVDIFGETFKLSDYFGKIIILDFWATWCPPCKKEIPDFIEIAKKYKNDVELIGLSMDDNEEIVKEFVKNNNVTYKIAMVNGSILAIYSGINAIPTTFIIDRKGNIVKRQIGYNNKEFFENEIKKLL